MASKMPTTTTVASKPLAMAYVFYNGTLMKMVQNKENRSSPNYTSGTTAPSGTVNNNGMTVFSIILIAMYIPFLLVAAFGNITVIIVRLKKFKQSGLSAYKQLICHLSLADIIYATAIPLDIYQRISKQHWIEHSSVCKILTTTQSASLTASVCILTTMAFERFQGISNPLAHRWSTKKVSLLVLAIWGYSYANFIPYAMALDVQENICHDFTYPHPQFAKWYTLYQFLSTWLLPVFLIIFFHFGMVFKVVKHRKTIKRSTYRSPADNGNSTKRRQKPKRKMVRILVVIVTLFALLTLPVHIWYLWYEFSDRSVTENYSLEVVEIFASLVYMHSAVNPIIYSIMDRSFREDVKSMLHPTPPTMELYPMRVINGATQESFER